MAELQMTNNATTVLGAPITAEATTCDLATGTGALFPTLATGEAFKATLVDAATGLINEIVLVTGISGDVITSMERGQEGTMAVSWLAGDHFSNLLTAGTMDDALAGQLINVRVITEGGTYTPSPGTAAIILKGTGGGGGGAGCPAPDSAHCALGESGGCGGYFECYITSDFAGVTITIGAGGAGGAAGENNGTAGGTTSFGSLVESTGGAGGSTHSEFAIPTYVGAVANGEATFSGGVAQVILAGVTTPPVLGACFAGGAIGVASAVGGSNPLGCGGLSFGVAAAGVSGNGYGSGGSGGVANESQAAQPGGAGLPGVIIVYEYS